MAPANLMNDSVKIIGYIPKRCYVYHEYESVYTVPKNDKE